MQLFRRQPWRISIRAKANQFEFRFRAWNLQPKTRFSIILHLRKFLLKVDSEVGDSVVRHRRGRSQWKIVQFFQKMFAQKLGIKTFFADKFVSVKGRPNPRQPKNAIPHKGQGRFLVKEYISFIAGFLALLSVSVSQNKHWEVIIYAATVVSCTIALSKSLIATKEHLCRVLAVLAVTLLGFAYILNYPIHISAFFWKAWKHAVSFGCLNIVSQAVLRRFSLFIRRYKSVGFIVSIVLSLLLLKIYLNAASNFQVLPS
ncbi:uncharacterized protein [Aristolochia californica]|uniref:uncharacterized protein n=1 Tax=Aristolochia californica TaxID=171875 RepID=UPI0035DE92EA